MHKAGSTTVPESARISSATAVGRICDESCGPRAALGARRRSRGRARGIALVWVLFASLVIAGVVLVGTSTQRAIDRVHDAWFSMEGQARAAADAGLVDG